MLIMKKTILSILFVFTINFVFSQSPITISSTCETLGHHGTYNYLGETNGKPHYKKDDCSIFTSSTDCSNASASSLSYNLFWNGSSWQLESFTSDCIWVEELCLPNVASSPFTFIASNSANTPLPPCSGWTFTTAPACTPDFTNCTTLGVNGFAFENNIEIFPNPIVNDFYITSKGNSDFLKVTILNSLGQIITTKEFANASEIKLNLNQPTGIYYAKITNKENQVAYFKLIKK